MKLVKNAMFSLITLSAMNVNAMDVNVMNYDRNGIVGARQRGTIVAETIVTPAESVFRDKAKGENPAAYTKAKKEWEKAENSRKAEATKAKKAADELARQEAIKKADHDDKVARDAAWEADRPAREAAAKVLEAANAEKKKKLHEARLAREEAAKKEAEARAVKEAEEAKDAKQAEEARVAKEAKEKIRREQQEKENVGPSSVGSYLRQNTRNVSMRKYIEMERKVEEAGVYFGKPNLVQALTDLAENLKSTNASKEEEHKALCTLLGVPVNGEKVN